LIQVFLVLIIATIFVRMLRTALSGAKKREVGARTRLDPAKKISAVWNEVPSEQEEEQRL
jgi:hypothetical protein